jgi:hypothetical protein
MDSMKTLACCFLLSLAVAAVGCRDRGVGLPTAPVSGKVMYRGKPLAFGRVIFFPPSGHAAGVQLAPDGAFTLTAYQGNNQVAVECLDADRPGSTKPRGRSMDENQSLIPERYMNYSTSGLTFDVKPGENANAELNLKD